MFVVDGLICSRLDRAGLQELVDAGIHCVTVTCGFWEDATESMDSIVRWRELARANADLADVATTAQQARTIGESGRVAIILGFQNSAFLQGRLGYVELFADIGVRVAQLTYNNQNDIGGSCYEPSDSGLTRFGEEVVLEMNRTGMAVDLSHVGNLTSRQAIELAERPVAITHANPYDLVDHPRNKSSDVLKALMDNGGVLGLTMYHNITRGYESDVTRWTEMVARTVDMIGIDHVGIGTDGNRGGDADYLRWMRNGRWSRREQSGASVATSTTSSGKSWYGGAADHSAIASALVDRGFNHDETAKILGENWMRFYADVFEPA